MLGLKFLTSRSQELQFLTRNGQFSNRSIPSQFSGKKQSEHSEQKSGGAIVETNKKGTFQDVLSNRRTAISISSFEGVVLGPARLSPRK